MKEKTDIEKKLIYLCEKYVDILIIIFALVVAIIIQREGCSRAPYGDYTAHFQLWFDKMRTEGFGGGICEYPKGFELIFWFLIKIGADNSMGLKCFVWIFDLIIAFSSYFLVKSICGDKMRASYAFAITLLLPSLVLNTSIFGQVDAIFVGFIVLALLVWHIGERFDINICFYFAGILVGVSLSMKQTAVLFLPIIVYCYFKDKRYTIMHFLMIPLGYILLCIPKWIASGNAYEAFLATYLEGEYTAAASVVVANFTNIYSLFPGGPSWSSWISDTEMSTIGNLFCISLLGIIFLYVIIKKKPQVDKIILLQIVFVVVICCTKPGIHDRYMLMADILSVIYCFISVDRYKWLIAGVINFVSFYNIMNYLHGCVSEISNTRIIIVEIISLIFVCFTIWIVKHLLEEFNDKKCMEQGSRLSNL